MTSNRFTIKTVSERTGLSTHVIRVWEQRFQLVQPKRSPSNRRLYSQEDIRHLQLLSRAVNSGYRIGDIADLSVVDLEAMLDTETDAVGAIPRSFPNTGNSDALKECIRSISALNSGALEATLRQATVSRSPQQLIIEIIMPLLNEIGMLWEQGKLRIMHEHLTTAVIRPLLIDYKNSYRNSKNPLSCVVGAPTGQLHEMGALISAVFAAAAGWNVIYLGADIPVEEIAAACLETQSTQVILSIIFPGSDPFLVRELQRMGTLLPPGVKVILGGRSADSYQQAADEIGAVVIRSLEQLQSAIAT